MSYKADSDTDASSRNSKLYRGKAPIASMDAMEDMDLLSGSNTHLSKLSSDGNMASNLGAVATTTTTSTTAASGASKLANPGGGLFPGIKYRHIGKSGLKVSNIGLGSIKVFNQENPEVSEEIVSLAFENGINYFDISDPYLADQAERQLGAILKKKGWSRKSYVVSTKIYWHRSEMPALSRKEIIESVKHSLANLGLDYIDLVIIHKSDPNCTIEEVVRAMNYLLDHGMTMYWGTSRWTPFEIFEAYSMAHEFKAIGPCVEIGEYHWFHREKVELYMAELHNKIGIGLMTWSPISFGLCLGDKTEENTQLFTKLSIKNHKFGGGGHKTMDAVAAVAPATIVGTPMIAGQSPPVTSRPAALMIGTDGTATPSVTVTATSQHQAAPAAPPDAATVSQSRIKALAGVADKLGCTLSQLAIAWCLRNQTSQSVIASAATTQHLMEILNSLPIIPKITHGVMEDIDKILCNKPVRPPMISTLQTRWSSTGGVPPC